MKTRICLLYGGKSAEHEVSLKTAKAVIQALDTKLFDITPIHITKEGVWNKGPQITGPIESTDQLIHQQGEHIVPNSINIKMTGDSENAGYDVIFPLLHGPNGEDGSVQGMLELMDVPYVGNGILASAAAMDKVIMKNLFAHEGLAQVNYIWFIRSTWEADHDRAYSQVEREIGYPCFVKPANLGSSVGISKCETREELAEAFKEAFRFDRKIIIEEGVNAREIEVGLLGNDFPECSIPGEIVPKKKFYDYKAKYEDGDTALIIPADISAETFTTIREMATKAFLALDCAGLVRADFFVQEDGKVLINEVNTMPGFTPVSMFPLLWKHSGVEYPQLIERLVALALDKHKEKQNIIHSF